MKDSRFIYNAERCLVNQFETRVFDDPLLPFKLGSHYNSQNQPFGGNWHKEIEIIQVLEGNGELFCNGQKVSMSPGEIFIINENETHRIDGMPFIRYNWISPCNDFFTDNGIEIDSIYFDRTLEDQTAYSLFSDAFEKLFRLICDPSYCPDVTDIPNARIDALRLFTYLTKNYSHSKSKTAKSNMFNAVQLGILYLNDKFRENITIEDVSKHVGLSKYHFIREFKKYTGHTVITYINSLRCDYARNLLLHSNHQVKDVCMLCGFDSLSYFSKVFKSATGVTPSRFKTMNKSDSST